MLVKKRQRAETLDALPSRQPAPAVAASVTWGEPSDTPLVPEEDADNSPLQQPAEQSGSVTVLQCSPPQTWAMLQPLGHIQTRQMQLQVQWPADGHRVVTMEQQLPQINGSWIINKKRRTLAPWICSLQTMNLARTVSLLILNTM